jgi:hypothetical protein
VVHVELLIPGITSVPMEVALDESMTASQAVADIARLAKLSLGIEVADEELAGLLLCDVLQQRVLVATRTLAESRIASGAQLILI